MTFSSPVATAEFSKFAGILSAALSQHFHISLQLAAEQLSTAECWIPPKKIPHIQGQRSSTSKMVGEVKLHLESNP